MLLCPWPDVSLKRGDKYIFVYRICKYGCSFILQNFILNAKRSDEKFIIIIFYNIIKKPVGEGKLYETLIFTCQDILDPDRDRFSWTRPSGPEIL